MRKILRKDRLSQNEEAASVYLYVASFGILAAIVVVAHVLGVLTDLIGSVIICAGIFGWGFQILPPRGWPGVLIGLIIAACGLAILVL
jgi:hypothetical protein